MHELPWNKAESITPHFNLHKIKEKIQFASLKKDCYDIVYFDAFAPKKQSDMWSIDVLSHVIGAIKANGILVTYCASGQLKRDLKALQMEVFSPPGPPGKLEMVRTTRHNFK